MTWLTALLELLARLFARRPPSPPPPGPAGPTAPTGPTAGPEPTTPIPEPTKPTPEPTTPVTPATPFRDLPVLSAERVCQILAGYPMEGECRLIHAALGGRPLALAQSYLESTYGRSKNAQRTRNALGLMQADGRTLMTFSTYAEGFAEWAKRMDDPAYKGGVYQPRDITLEQMIVTYVGGPGCWSTRGATCANGESWASTHRYLDETVARLNRYYGLPDAPSPTDPTGPSRELTFGRVPKPANYSERIIAPDGVNTAFSTGSTRIPRGIVLHRMIGTLEGTDSYFRTDARHRALTDFGLGLGKVYRWTKPGANIAPYASGASSPAFSVASGDGIAFVNRYGWRQNWDCESIEIEGRQYTDPVPSADYQRLVELVAWRVDAWLRVAWNVWPKNNDGLHCLFWHNEFQNEKPCPGTVVMELTDDLIRDVAARLRSYQESR